MAEVLKHPHFVTLHVPLVAATRDLVNADNVAQLRPGAVLLNFPATAWSARPRCSLALARGQLGSLVCDFPGPALNGRGAWSRCPPRRLDARGRGELCGDGRRPAARLLEHGNVANAVNFPAVAMSRESAHRVAIANANVPNMLGQIRRPWPAPG